MSSRSRFSPFLPGLFFAATCVFFVFAASCVYFEKNKDGGIFGENPKTNARNARGKLPRSRIFGCEEAKVAELGQEVHGSGSGKRQNISTRIWTLPEKNRPGRKGGKRGRLLISPPYQMCAKMCMRYMSSRYQNE